VVPVAQAVPTTILSLTVLLPALTGAAVLPLCYALAPTSAGKSTLIAAIGVASVTRTADVKNQLTPSATYFDE